MGTSYGERERQREKERTFTECNLQSHIFTLHPEAIEGPFPGESLEQL